MQKNLTYAGAGLLGLIAVMFAGAGAWRLANPAGPTPTPGPAPVVKLAEIKTIADTNPKAAKAWGKVYRAFAWAVRRQKGTFTMPQVNAARTRLFTTYVNEGMEPVKGLDGAVRKAIVAELGNKPTPADKDKVADFYDSVALSLGA